MVVIHKYFSGICMLVDFLPVVVHLQDSKENQLLLCYHLVFCHKIIIEQDLFHFVCVLNFLPVVVHLQDSKENQLLLCYHLVFCHKIIIEQDFFHFVCVLNLLYIVHKKCTPYFVQSDHLHLIIVESIFL